MVVVFFPSSSSRPDGGGGGVALIRPFPLPPPPIARLSGLGKKKGLFLSICLPGIGGGGEVLDGRSGEGSNFVFCKPAWERGGEEEKSLLAVRIPQRALEENF